MVEEAQAGAMLELPRSVVLVAMEEMVPMQAAEVQAVILEQMEVMEEELEEVVRVAVVQMKMAVLEVMVPNGQLMVRVVVEEEAMFHLSQMPMVHSLFLLQLVW